MNFDTFLIFFSDDEELAGDMKDKAKLEEGICTYKELKEYVMKKYNRKEARKQFIENWNADLRVRMARGPSTHEMLRVVDEWLQGAILTAAGAPVLMHPVPHPHAPVSSSGSWRRRCWAARRGASPSGGWSSGCRGRSRRRPERGGFRAPPARWRHWEGHERREGPVGAEPRRPAQPTPTARRVRVGAGTGHRRQPDVLAPGAG